MGQKDTDLNLKMNYDREGDVLYLTVGEPQKAITEEVEGPVLFRVNSCTGQLVGVTSVDFLNKFPKKKLQ